MRLDHVIYKVFSSPTKTGESEYLVVCPFHDDTKPSCSINTEKLLFKCHACGAKGTAAAVIAKELQATEALVQAELLHLKEMPVLPEFNAQFFHKKLLVDKMLEYLIKERFWTKEVIEKFVIGYDGNRITIPVHNLFGDLVNVRAYKTKASKSEDKFINLKGFGKARVFNPVALTARVNPYGGSIIICEGEPDCLAATSQGFSAVAGTAGAGHSRFIGAAWCSWPTAIVYDVDEAGVTGAGKLSESFGGPHKILNISSLVGDGGKDFTDALKAGASREQFISLIDETSITTSVASLPVQRRIRDYGDPTPVTLQESGEERFYHKLVSMKVMVSGKTLSPYLVPSKVEVTCPLPGLNMCKGCGLGALGGKSELEFDHLNPATLDLIETTALNQVAVFKQMLGIPYKCRQFTVDVLEAQNIEEAKVIPVLEYSLDESEYVMRQIYYVGHGLKPNRSYELHGLTLPHPKTQQVTYMINDAEGLEDSVASFTVTDEIKASLKIFQVVNEEDQGQIR